MIDREIERLRHLRASALRVRSVARAFGASRLLFGDPLFASGGRIAWRVARAVTGKLRAHPHAGFQKDASLGVLIKNSVIANLSLLTASNRSRALKLFESELKALTRELDDVRALTWAADFGDVLNRSHNEMRAAVAAAECESVPATSGGYPHRTFAEVRSGNATGSDWPYLAI